MPDNLLQPQSPLNIATDKLHKLLSQLDKLDSDHRKTVAIQTLKSLDIKDREEAIRLAGGLGLPDQYELSIRRRMRWFVLIIIAIGFLGSIAASIALIISAKIFLTLIVPPSLTLIFRPIVHWLFPSEQHNKILITTLLSTIGTHVGAKKAAKKVARKKKDKDLASDG